MSEANLQIHQDQPLVTAGSPLESASAVMIMLHGRGAPAEDILQLAPEFDYPEIAFLAPQAANYTWYPNSFLAPISSNEPWLSSALAMLKDLCLKVETEGPGLNRTILLGFSQGACLASEFAARNARRYGGIVGFTGGLIGPEGTPHNYGGSLESTPVFLGTSDPDPHVPRWRVEETAEVLSKLNAQVITKIYPGMGHTINREEINLAREVVARIFVS